MLWGSDAALPAAPESHVFTFEPSSNGRPAMNHAAEVGEAVVQLSHYHRQLFIRFVYFVQAYVSKRTGRHLYAEPISIDGVGWFIPWQHYSGSKTLSIALPRAFREQAGMPVRGLAEYAEQMAAEIRRGSRRPGAIPKGDYVAKYDIKVEGESPSEHRKVKANYVHTALKKVLVPGSSSPTVIKPGETITITVTRVP